MPSTLTQITNQATHDKIVDESAQTPTVIYVSNSALPICKSFTPKYEALQDKYNGGNNGQMSVRFCQLEISSETSAMFKFSPNQLPVIVLCSRGPWSRTLMSPSVAKLEEAVEDMLERTGRVKN